MAKKVNLGVKFEVEVCRKLSRLKAFELFKLYSRPPRFVRYTRSLVCDLIAVILFTSSKLMPGVMIPQRIQHSVVTIKHARTLRYKSPRLRRQLQLCMRPYATVCTR